MAFKIKLRTGSANRVGIVMMQSAAYTSILTAVSLVRICERAQSHYHRWTCQEENPGQSHVQRNCWQMAPVPSTSRQLFAEVLLVRLPTQRADFVTDITAALLFEDAAYRL